MRNPSRIPLVIRKLEIAWRLVPDWRLCQLVSNAHGNGRQDIFHTEDNEFEKYLDDIILEYSRINAKGK